MMRKFNRQPLPRATKIPSIIYSSAFIAIVDDSKLSTLKTLRLASQRNSKTPSWKRNQKKKGKKKIEKETMRLKNGPARPG